MESLPNRHLTTLTLDVDFGGTVPIGPVASGRRGIAPVRGGRFVGERLSGTVRPGADWFIARPNGDLAIDVRLTLDTDDGAVLYLAYAGTMRGRGDAMARFRKGEALAAQDYALHTVARFEGGGEKYAWLSDALVVGIGAQTAGGPVYTLYEIG